MNPSFVRSLCLVLGSLCLLTESGVANVQEPTLLKCGNVIDVESKRVLPNTSILVEGEMIDAVGTSVSAPDGATVIDLSDRSCAPGFMDTHVHLAHDSGFNFRIYTRSSAERALKTLRNAQAMLDAGFTTLRSTGGFDRYFETVEVRNAIDRGEFVGPRMFVAPKGIAGDGGMYTYPRKAIDPEGIRPADDAYIMNVVGVVEARRAAAKEIRHGGDWIKLIDATEGGLTLEEMRAIVDQAHRMGARVTVQSGGDLSMVEKAVEAGVDSVEHATFGDTKLLERMARDGVFLVPTLWIADFMSKAEIGYEYTPEQRITPEMISAMGTAFEFMSDNTAVAYKAGVKMALGTDFLMDPDAAQYTPQEFRLMSEAVGGDNWFALRAGTIVSAEMLGKDAEIGSIKEGKYADIVAMPGNPVEDIATVENVTFVMKGGEIVRRD